MAIALSNELENEDDYEKRILIIMIHLTYSYIAGALTSKEKRQAVREGVLKIGELLK